MPSPDRPPAKTGEPAARAPAPEAPAPAQAPRGHPAALLRRARLAPASLTPGDVLRLQRAVGNRATGALLSGARTAPPDALQRKVGFEFETAVKLATSAPPPQYAIPYGVQVFESANGDWEVKSDNSKVEFVTRAVEDDDAGQLRLAGMMAELTAWARAMCALTQSAAPVGSGRVADVAPQRGTARQYAHKDVVLYNRPVAAGALHAAPQATGGVTLDKIPQLIERLVSTRLEHLKRSSTFRPIHAPPVPTGNQAADLEAQEQYDIISGTPATYLGEQGFDVTDISYRVGTESLYNAGALVEARDKVERWVQWVEELSEGDAADFALQTGIATGEFRRRTAGLQGLMVLVISYLITGSRALGVFPYTKAIATLMSRTNFHALHALLSPQERTLFAAGTLEVAEMDGGEPLFRKGFKRGKEEVLPGPTRAEWIDSISQGTTVPGETPEDPPRVLPFDRLSQGSGTPEARNSSSLGAFEHPDYNPRSGAADLAVLEVRNIPKGQGIDDWTPTAMIIFELFRALNETPEEARRRAARERRLREDAITARGEPYAYAY